LKLTPIGKFIFIVKKALIQGKRNFFLSIISTTTIAFIILILGSYLFVIENVYNRLKNEIGEFTVIILLKDNVNEKKIEIIKEKLSSRKDVENVRVIDRKESKRFLRDEFPLSEGLSEYFFPQFIELVPKKEFREPFYWRKMLNEFTSESDVVEYSVSDKWFEMYTGFLKGLKLIAIFLCLTVGISGMFVIANTLKLQLFSQENDIEIMEIVGGTRTFILTPIFLNGFMQGAIGSIFSVALMFIIFISFRKFLPADFLFLKRWIVIALILYGCLIGFLGGIYSIIRWKKPG